MDSAANPDQPVSVPASSGVPSAGPSMAVPVGNTINPRKVPWTSATPVAEGLKITWTSGVEPCYSLDRVEVTETASTVTVTLWEGTTDEEAVCIEIAIEKATIVKLAKPLNGREVVDGAK